MAMPEPSQQDCYARCYDLTYEPDSPVGQRHSHPPSQIRRNVRRTNSQRIIGPSGSRSDSTRMGVFIDLTIHSPENERDPEPQNNHQRPPASSSSTYNSSPSSTD
ncbi:cell cycle control protein [Metarhizium brunneum]